MFLFLAVFMSLMLGTKNIDVMGHLGGFIFGAVIGLWTMPCHEENQQRKETAKWISLGGKIGTGALFALFLILFYTVRDPSEKYHGSSHYEDNGDAQVAETSTIEGDQVVPYSQETGTNMEESG